MAILELIFHITLQIIFKYFISPISQYFIAKIFFMEKNFLRDFELLLFIEGFNQFDLKSLINYKI
jgi:hypothetical protein